MNTKPALDRFIAKVEFTDTCWLWRGGLDGNGYGGFSVGSRTFGAYRWLYELINGPIPAGLELDHLCRVPACVNPDHLEPVTHRENMLRGMGSARKTHCPAGHPYDEKNTYYQNKGGKLRAFRERRCRLCMAAYQRKYSKRQRHVRFNKNSPLTKNFRKSDCNAGDSPWPISKNMSGRPST